jgi:radical SAM superfamily enzyme YgiQ (UPF0313 family)
MNILLVNPPRFPYVGRRLSVGRVQRCESIDQTQCLPPIDFLYSSALLKQDGHQVVFIDANAADYTFDELKKLMERVEFDLLVQKSAINVSDFDLKASAIAKEVQPDCIALSRSLASLGVEEYFLGKHPALDGFVFGEPEAVLPELAASLEGGKRLEDMPGLSLRSGRTSASQLYVKDLDTLPLPDFSAANPWNYWSGGPERAPLWLVWSSRGCPYSCKFCVIGGSRFPFPYRTRSAKKVVDELEVLVDMGLDKFCMFDETFLIPPHSKKVCQEIVRRGLHKKLWWFCNGKLDIVTEEMVAMASEAGCRDISFGIETGDPRLLKEAQKCSGIDRIKEIWSWQEKYGVRFFASFVIGLPGENDESVALTKRLIRELRIESAFFSLFTPYPCTTAYDEACQLGSIEVEGFDAYDQFDPRAPVMRTEAFSRDELRGIQKEYYRMLFKNRASIFLEGFCRHPWQYARKLPKAVGAVRKYIDLYRDPIYLR